MTFQPLPTPFQPYAKVYAKVPANPLPTPVLAHPHTPKAFAPALGVGAQPIVTKGESADLIPSTRDISGLGVVRRMYRFAVRAQALAMLGKENSMIAAINNTDGKVVAVGTPGMNLAGVLALVPLGEGVRASRRWRRPNKRGAEHGEVGVHLHQLGDGMKAELGESVDDLHRRDAFRGAAYLGFHEVSA